MRWDAPESLEEVRPVETARRLREEREEHTWAIETRDEQGYVGMISIRREEPDRTWSIGFWIHPDRWNEGYATEAARAVVAHGFERLGASAIRAAHATWNVASRRVIEKLGMRYVGDKPKGFMKRGGWVPEREYELTRAAWRTS